MTDRKMEHERARVLDAVHVLIDGRDLVADMASIMVTLEAVVATTLLAICNRDARKAVGMLNEGLLQGVEERIALGETRKKAAR